MERLEKKHQETAQADNSDSA